VLCIIIEYHFGMTMSYNPSAMRARLSEALKQSGTSMRKASLDAGFSETFAHGVLKLGRDPGVENLTTLCDSLGLSVSYIIFGHDISPETEELLRLFQENPEKRKAILQLMRE
jgi:lambda repressor-like predicted transcriptional regulator